MSDQFGNNVDKEVWVPAKAKDWLGTAGVGTVPPVSRRLTDVIIDSCKEYALAHADGSINEDCYSNEGTARQELQYIRKQLKAYGVPEEYHPILMERTVETVAGSWKPLSV